MKTLEFCIGICYFPVQTVRDQSPAATTESVNENKTFFLNESKFNNGKTF